MPGVEVDHAAGVVAEVAQQPPEAFRPAHVPVGDDEDTVADACPTCGGSEDVRFGKRMPPTRSRRRGKVAVDVEEARARDVSFEIELAPAAGIAELPAAVDELVAQTYQLPPGDAGNVPRITERSYGDPTAAVNVLFPSGGSISLRNFMTRANVEPVVFTPLILARLTR